MYLKKRKEKGILFLFFIFILYFIEIVVSKAEVLKELTFFKNCNAKIIQYESKRFCCCDGEIILAHCKLPNELYELFIVDSREGK